MRKKTGKQRRADAVYVPSPVSTHLHWQIGKDCLGIRVIQCIIELVIHSYVDQAFCNLLGHFEAFGSLELSVIVSTNLS